MIQLPYHRVCSGVGTAFPHLFLVFALVTSLENLDYFKTWLRSHRCVTVLLLATRRFVMLVSSLRRSSVEILVGECSLYSNYLVQISFLFGMETPFPNLFIALHPCISHLYIRTGWTFVQLPTAKKGLQLSLYNHFTGCQKYHHWIFSEMCYVNMSNLQESFKNSNFCSIFRKLASCRSAMAHSSPGTPEQQQGRGTAEELTAMETCKK